MNEKEAREDIGYYGDPDKSEWAVDRQAWMAKGYLECFEQMKPLVNLIISIQTWAKSNEKVEIRGLCDEALSNWKKTQEKKL